MDCETWLEKAERPQSSLTPEGGDDDSAARERIKIALWLRREFSGQPVKDLELLPGDLL